MESEQQEGIEQQVGRRLRLARERQGRSLEDLERAITIHAHHLEALERGDFDALPSPLWARGFIQMYANHLGLEGEELAQKVFPLRRTSRPKRYLRRHWRVLIATLGTIGVAAAITATVIIAPYNAVTRPLDEFLHRVMPDTFMGPGPARIVVVGFADSETTGEGNVMVARIAQDSIGVLSIPSNTLVEMPGQRAGEIGDASALGGPDLTRRAVARLTGVEVPHYLAISAEGIKRIVNAMGGVRIDVSEPNGDQAWTGEPKITLNSGSRVLDGDQALSYLQGEDISSDVERAERQQAFLSTIFRQALSPGNLLSNPSTLGAVFKHSETNLSFIEVSQLASRIKVLKESGAGTKIRMVPGREEAAYPRQGGTQNTYWIPDTRKLPIVLKETVR